MPRNTAVFAPTTGEGIDRSDDITKDPRTARTRPAKGCRRATFLFVAISPSVISRTGEVLGALYNALLYRACQRGCLTIQSSWPRNWSFSNAYRRRFFVLLEDAVAATLPDWYLAGLI